MDVQLGLQLCLAALFDAAAMLHHKVIREASAVQCLTAFVCTGKVTRYSSMCQTVTTEWGTQDLIQRAPTFICTRACIPEIYTLFSFAHHKQAAPPLILDTAQRHLGLHSTPLHALLGITQPMACRPQSTKEAGVKMM